MPQPLTTAAASALPLIFLTAAVTKLPQLFIIAAEASIAVSATVFQ